MKNSHSESYAAAGVDVTAGYEANSDEKGSPEPPPVQSPNWMILFSSLSLFKLRIAFTKSLVAL